VRSVITLQFSLALAIDVAEQQVQAAISGAQNLLPQDLAGAADLRQWSIPPTPPVLTLGLTSKVMPLTEVEDMADTRIAQKISQIKGVGVVSISGGQRPAVRVVANPPRHGGLRTESRRSAHDHQQRQSKRSEGYAGWPEHRLHGQYQRSDPKRGGLWQRRGRLQERRPGPAKGRSRNWSRAPKNAKLGGWMNRVPALILNVQRQPGANVVDVRQSNPHSAAFAAGRAARGVDLAILTDRTTTIRASVADVEFELVLAVVLVVLVIYVFLPAQCSGHHHSQSFRAAVPHRHLCGDVPGEFSASIICR